MHSEQQFSEPIGLNKSDLDCPWPPSLLRLVLAAAITAGLSYAAIVFITTNPIFVVLEKYSNIPETSPPDLFALLDKEKYKVDGMNLSIVFGLVGAIFGAICVLLTFGMKSFKAMGVAVVCATALGVVGLNLSNALFYNSRVAAGKDLPILGFKLDSMGQAILGYSLLWGLIGLGVGLGIGSVRGVAKSLIAGISGLCGGVLGAMLFVVLTAQFSIGTTLNRVFPHGNIIQAIWLLLFTVAIAVCIALGSGERRRKPVA